MISLFVQIVIFAMIGMITGLLSGLLGIGGGVISVPCMVFLFQWMHFSSRTLMQVAIASSLAAVIFTTFSSTRSHHLHKRVHWSTIKKMLFGVSLGAVTGALSVHHIPTQILQKTFGICEIVLGLYFFGIKKPSAPTYPFKLPHTILLNLIGYGISMISTIMGVGGSFLSIPIFLRCNFPMRIAIGTSTAIAFVLATIASIIFLIPGFFMDIDPHSLGYLYLPAVIPMSIAAFFSAPLGSKAIQYISTIWLRKLFGIMIFIAGIFMIVRN